MRPTLIADSRMVMEIVTSDPANVGTQVQEDNPGPNDALVLPRNPNVENHHSISQVQASYFIKLQICWLQSNALGPGGGWSRLGGEELECAAVGGWGGLALCVLPGAS